ncbi:MAG: methyltransferase, partial [Spartobacteria bacterium]
LQKDVNQVSRKSCKIEASDDFWPPQEIWMNVATRVRRDYDAFPYPRVGRSRKAHAVWQIVPMEWIEALGHAAWRTPKRILVAGCGTGREAFALRRLFPNAEIFGIDFSKRSIAIACNLQRALPKTQQIRFLCADLNRRHFRKIVRGEFDFISCHGVLSYIPRPKTVLNNLAEGLASNGILYLGVNGAQHYSERWRTALPDCGFKQQSFKDGRELRRTLQLFDALDQDKPAEIATQGAEYLASDLFGHFIANRPLAYWIKATASCGLRFLGDYSTQWTIRRALNDNVYESFIPRSRAQVHELVEKIVPSAFHRLLFSFQTAKNPPWKLAHELKLWRVSSTKICSQRWPRRRSSWTALRRLKIASEPTNSLIEMSVPEWQVEILRQRDSNHCLRDILNEAWPEISPREFRKAVYELHLLALIKLEPPV